jgi:uncharacterized protein (TIGR02246 family)
MISVGCVRAAVATALLVSTGCAPASPARAEGSAASSATASADDSAAIRAIISSYEAALNASNTDAAMALYAADGVLMSPHQDAMVGATALRDTYERGSRINELSGVKLNVIELVQVAPTWAFARTNSTGTLTVRATGAKRDVANQELFLLRKDGGGAWKIARYCFTPTHE